jgi:hypothetical protein
MLTPLILAVALTGQHHAHHPAAHAGGHVGGHIAGGFGGHPFGPMGAAMQHQIMQEVLQHQFQMQQQHLAQQAHHAAMIRQDMPHLEAWFSRTNYDGRHMGDLRFHHNRLGPEAFWRLARQHREIDKLLAALREEKALLPRDSPEGRLARVKTRHEMWDLMAESRFNAYLRERKFDHEHWESLRFYYQRLGPDSFWRIARDHRELDPLRTALSVELRRALLDGLEEPPKLDPAGMPREDTKPLGTGLIEISPVETKHGKTTNGP